MPELTLAGYFFNASSLPIRTRAAQSRPFSITPHQRAASDDPPNSDAATKPNPVMEDYLRKNPTQKAQPQMQAGGRGSGGDLSASSIFEDERRAQEQVQQQAERAEMDSVGGVPEMESGLKGRNPEHMKRILDPTPDSRIRWERKKVIQMVRKGGRLNKQQFIKRTEREHLVKSVNLKTSVKKLGMLARQISGKTIDDAITQMRFSKKKVAIEVRKQLEFARDEAVVMRGMGLGNVRVVGDDGTLEATAVTASDTPALEGKASEEPLEIQLKSGKRHKVADRNDIYIDQAWVGRGPYGQLPDFRARGRVFVMRTPWTSITLLLKEEATRIREYGEREEKRRRQKLDNVWVHLPDRPIQTKQQWYSW